MKTLTACIALFLISFCGMAWAADEKPADDKDAAVAAPAKTMNMCAMCHVLSETPGKCPKCGMEMTKCHVLAVKDGTALCCTCGPECTCKPAGDDMTKCTCGKDIVKVSDEVAALSAEARAEQLLRRPLTPDSAVQIALLTERIKDLSGHLKANKKDNSSTRGLLKMVGQRRRLLNYLKRIDLNGYTTLLKQLDLRK